MPALRVSLEHRIQVAVMACARVEATSIWTLAGSSLRAVMTYQGAVRGFKHQHGGIAPGLAVPLFRTHDESRAMQKRVSSTRNALVSGSKHSHPGSAGTLRSVGIKDPSKISFKWSLGFKFACSNSAAGDYEFQIHSTGQRRKIHGRPAGRSPESLIHRTNPAPIKMENTMRFIRSRRRPEPDQGQEGRHRRLWRRATPMR